jgi:hypothetical protein
LGSNFKDIVRTTPIATPMDAARALLQEMCRTSL